MLKKEEKAKVGRPKLADDVRKKDSWTTIGICTAMALVLCIGGIGDFTGRTPWQVLSFQNGSKISASVAAPVTKTRVISAQKSVNKKIVPSGNVRIIPALKSRIVKIK